MTQTVKIILLISSFMLIQCSDSESVSVYSDTIGIQVEKAGRSVNLRAYTKISGDSISSTLWDFGDTVLSGLLEPSHVYSAYGTYTVTLIATMMSGEEQTIYSEIELTPPRNKPTNWKNIGSIPNGNDINDIAWNGHQWIAVGQNGDILLSFDGVDWYPSPSRREEDLEGVTWNGSRFIVTGSTDTLGTFQPYVYRGVILESQPDDSWHVQSTHYDGHRPAAVSTADVTLMLSSHIYVSQEPRNPYVDPDDKLWKRQDDGTWQVIYDGYQLENLSYCNGFFFVEHKLHGRSDRFQGYINGFHVHMRSANGADWETISQQGLGKIDFNGTHYYAAKNGTIRRSLDGLEWEEVFINDDLSFHSIKASEKLVAVVGENGILATSSDGENWSQTTLDPSIDLSCIDFNGILWVACGEKGRFYWSDDGIEWNREAEDPLLQQVFHSVVAHNDQFYLVGDQGTFLFSPNGLDWEPLPFPESMTLLDVTFTPHGMLMVARSTEEIPRSEIWLNQEDGWQQVFQTTDEDLTEIAFYEETIVAAGNRNGFAYKSRDGLNWEPIDHMFPGDMNDLSVYQGVFYVGSDRLRFDSNGNEEIQSSQRPPTCATNGEQSVYFEYNFGFYSFYAETIQGRTDILNDPAIVINQIIWDGSRFVAIGGLTFSRYNQQRVDQETGSILTSENGIDWEFENAPHFPSLQRVATLGHTVLGIGHDHTIALGNLDRSAD